MLKPENLRAASLAAALGAVLLASSCASFSNNGAISADPVENHPITVTPTFKSMKVSFATPGGGLIPQDELRFKRFVKNYIALGNGAISVSVPKGPDSNAVIHYFGERLVALGVPRSNILVGTRTIQNGDARIKLGYITYHASTAPCGDWSTNVADTSSNLPMPNFGCANQHNLAAMVSDPRDLVEPRSMDAGDATRRDAVIQNYEQGKPTAATKTPDQSANVSGIQ